MQNNSSHSIFLFLEDIYNFRLVWRWTERREGHKSDKICVDGFSQNCKSLMDYIWWSTVKSSQIENGIKWKIIRLNLQTITTILKDFPVCSLVFRTITCSRLIPVKRILYEKRMGVNDRVFTKYLHMLMITNWLPVYNLVIRWLYFNKKPMFWPT